MSISDVISSAVMPPGADLAKPDLIITGTGESEDFYPVTELATQSIAAASFALARYAIQKSVAVDRRLASMWFNTSLRPQGWQLPSVWDEFSGNYRTCDGWIRLHTNAIMHRKFALAVLGNPKDRAAAERAVERCSAFALQEAVVGAGGAAAVMYSAEQWSVHPQGAMVMREPLVSWHMINETKADYSHRSCPDAPLSGIKVLDLTRIIAGPTATRFLAAFGAFVLRIDPPGWDEIGNIPEMTPGKRCASLDLKSPKGKHELSRLIAEADVLVHGYRADALERLGFGEAERRKLNPKLIDVAVNAFGWTGPWWNRRGFDSLVQMSSGIAEAGMCLSNIDKPSPLKVQALDHATGYCIAATILNALSHRRDTGQVASARLSLATTAEVLKNAQTPNPSIGKGLALETIDDIASVTENTEWGPAQRLNFPMKVANIKARWSTPAVSLHTSAPRFSDSSTN
jgi:hypothetical protein